MLCTGVTRPFAFSTEGVWLRQTSHLIQYGSQWAGWAQEAPSCVVKLLMHKFQEKKGGGGGGGGGGE